MRAEPAALALATGEVFFGYGFGSSEPAEGEVVFNTSMTGYQEITTDASYRGQIVTLTYPLINNYGVNADDVESRRPWLAGLVVRELAPTSSNWRASGGLGDFLEEHGIAGLMGVGHASAGASDPPHWAGAQPAGSRAPRRGPRRHDLPLAAGDASGRISLGRGRG